MIEALRNLFKANGFNVIRYNGNSDFSSLPDERLVVRGQINEFWMNGYPGGRGTAPSIQAKIDIDLTIIDTKIVKPFGRVRLKIIERLVQIKAYLPVRIGFFCF